MTKPEILAPQGTRASSDPAVHAILVEDDHDLRQGLADYLRLSGIIVTDVPSGIAFYKALRTTDFDVAILDVNLPDTSGYDLARDLATERRVGVIMLTARSSREDRVRGYAEGADIYLTKPVDGEELLHAVRNLARRVHETRHALAQASGENISPAPATWRLDKVHHRLLSPEGTSISLSGRELMMLDCLAEAGGATVSRAVLAKHMGYADIGSESRSLDAVLRRLRQKANDHTIDLPVRAVHAVGIRFSAPLAIA